MQEPDFNKRLAINLLTLDCDTHSLLYKLETPTKLNEISYEVSNFVCM